MILTYENYLKERNSLTFSEMQKIHADMVAEIGTDEDALELYDELVGMAVKYSGIREKWLGMERQKRMEQDEKRTLTHDSLIVKVNQLWRFIGKESAWRETLGEDRKRIGDFACYLAFINGLCAR